MTLYELKIGKSKTKLRKQMIDDITAINAYLKSRGAVVRWTKAAGKSGKLADGKWFEITLAPIDADVYKKHSATVNGSKCHSVPRIGRNNVTRIPGYINKHGFQPHT
jgi:hypothetical protein